MATATAGYTVKVLDDRVNIYKSDGTCHAVSFTGDDYHHCTCPGFRFRHTCKHLAMAKEAREAERSSAPPIENKTTKAQPERYPREHFDDAINYVRATCRRYGPVKFAGSWRRGLDTMKDLDVIVECSPQEFQALYDISFLSLDEWTTTAQGTDIIRGMLGDCPIDITRVNAGYWGAYELYRTGSASFNIWMRSYARRLGYTLSERGLVNSDGVCVAKATEQEIFDALGIPFVAPSKR